jgi:hypothetical protein
MTADVSQLRNSSNERKGWIMKTMLFHTITLGALLTLTAASQSFAMDHGSMNHGSMAGMNSDTPAAVKRARPGVEIRKTVVAGYSVTYNLVDMQEMMNGPMSKMMTHEGGKMKTHHLMVYAATPEGKPAIDGKAGFLVVLPDKSEVKLMAMRMMDGFGGDVDLVSNGDYKITTKIALGSTTLVDEFIYTLKPPASGAKPPAAVAMIAVVNTKCPISGGALNPAGVPENLTRVYKGQKIGFCCEGCPEEWDKLTDVNKDAELAKAKKDAK